MTTGILYVSYDGLLEPLGQSQVLAYLKRLTPGRRMHLLTFEKSADWSNVTERKRIETEVAKAGIVWHALRYHKSPSSLATAWDISQGILVGAWLVLRYRLRIVHARSYVAALMAMVLQFAFGVKFVFDMRGFWADERLDGGLWVRQGRKYRLAKFFERRFLLSADHVISLTHSAVREMRRFPYLQRRMPPVTIIPTCADLERFLPSTNRRDTRVDSAKFVLGYVGSAGTWYLFDKTVACFAQLMRSRPEARLLVVNRGEHAFIRRCLADAGVPESAIELTSATHADVPALIRRMDAGIFFIKPAFSKQASAPTKLAEFLGCGIPCLGNTGVGDMAEILEGERVGVALKNFDRESILEGLTRLLTLVSDPDTSSRCVAAARKYFSLEEGVRRYAAIYDELSEDSLG